METITFRELVKMIHPDLNPEVIDPGTKMATAKRHRDNPSILFDFAVRWGLIKGNGATGNNTGKHTHTTYTTNDNDLIFTCGNEVVFRSRRANVNATIVDIVKGKGRRSHQYKIFMVDAFTGKIYHFFLTHLNVSSVGGVRVVRKSDTHRMERAERSYRRYKDMIASRKNFKDRMKKEREERTKEDLRPNTRYWDEDIWIVSKTIHNLLRVTRTTKKRVYYWDFDLNKERFVNMSSVIRVIKRG